MTQMQARQARGADFKGHRREHSPGYWITEVARRGGRFYMHGEELRLHGGKLSPDELAEVGRISAGIIAQLEDIHRCLRCERELPPARVYVCAACQLEVQAAPVLPSLESYGLRIPFGSDPRYHWWAGGQSAEATARELGADEETVQRYYNPNPTRFQRGKSDE